MLLIGSSIVEAMGLSEATFNPAWRCLGSPLKGVWEWTQVGSCIDSKLSCALEAMILISDLDMADVPINPRGSRMSREPIFETSGSKSRHRYGCWNQKPQMLGMWILWEIDYLGPEITAWSAEAVLREVHPWNQALLQTGDAFLLEHNSHVGRDVEWSDNGQLGSSAPCFVS